MIVGCACSAGVGRTGTYLAIDYLLSEAISEGHVDVYKHVKALRAQRMHCVQTLVTYTLILVVNNNNNNNNNNNCLCCSDGQNLTKKLPTKSLTKIF